MCEDAPTTVGHRDRGAAECFGFCSSLSSHGLEFTSELKTQLYFDNFFVNT